jgi:hypothetical protein
MKALIISALTLLSVQALSEVTAVLKNPVRTKAETTTLLWDSANEGLDSHIYCDWKKSEDEIYKMELKSCYFKTLMNHFTFGYLGGGIDLISEGKLSYNVQTCEVKMDEKIVGNWKKGCSKDPDDKGISLGGLNITIDEINSTMELRVDNSVYAITGDGLTIWDSVGRGHSHVNCDSRESKDDPNTMELSRCFFGSYLETIKTKSAQFVKKVEVLTDGKITYKKDSCDVYMNDEVVGHSYNSCPENGVSEGIRFSKLDVVIDEENAEMSLR